MVYHAGKPIESVLYCFYKIRYYELTGTINHRFLTNQNARTILVILNVSYPINDNALIASTSLVLSNLLCLSIQGLYRSWKTWKVIEFKYFSFQAWKVMEFNIVGHGK